MQDKIIESIKSIRGCLLANENKPTSVKQVFDSLKGSIPMVDLHYAIRVMTEKRTVARVKQGTYVLTDSKKPEEAYISVIRKRKARKPRTVNPAVSLEKQLEKWDAEENKVDWKDLCQKLQSALAKAYVDCDLLEATVSEQKVVIRYLENRTVV